MKFSKALTRNANFALTSKEFLSISRRSHKTMDFEGWCQYLATGVSKLSIEPIVPTVPVTKSTR